MVLRSPKGFFKVPRTRVGVGYKSPYEAFVDEKTMEQVLHIGALHTGFLPLLILSYLLSQDKLIFYCQLAKAHMIVRNFILNSR